jgi:hypothetical protein
MRGTIQSLRPLASGEVHKSMAGVWFARAGGGVREEQVQKKERDKETTMCAKKRRAGWGGRMAGWAWMGSCSKDQGTNATCRRKKGQNRKTEAWKDGRRKGWKRFCERDSQSVRGKKPQGNLVPSRPMFSSLLWLSPSQGITLYLANQFIREKNLLRVSVPALPFFHFYPAKRKAPRLEGHKAKRPSQAPGFDWESALCILRRNTPYALHPVKEYFRFVRDKHEPCETFPGSICCCSMARDHWLPAIKSSTITSTRKIECL